MLILVFNTAPHFFLGYTTEGAAAFLTFFPAVMYVYINQSAESIVM